MENEFVFSAKEVAAMLNIAQSTLRTWCIQMEKNGYEWRRDENNNRFFGKRDIDALQQMKGLLSRGKKLADASKEIVARVQIASATEVVIAENSELAIADKASLERFRDDLLDLMEERMRKVMDDERQQRESFERRMEERAEERDRVLMQTLRELHEQKKRPWWRLGR